MKNLAQLIGTLNGFTFNSTSKDGALIGESKEGDKISVNHSFEMSDNMATLKDLPLYVNISVFLNDSHVMTWGCISNEENAAYVLWYKQTEGKVFKAKFESDRANSEAQQKIFKTYFK